MFEPHKAAYFFLNLAFMQLISCSSSNTFTLKTLSTEISSQRTSSLAQTDTLNSLTLDLLKPSKIELSLSVEHLNTWHQKLFIIKDMENLSIGGLSEFWSTKWLQDKTHLLLMTQSKFTKISLKANFTSQKALTMMPSHLSSISWFMISVNAMEISRTVFLSWFRCQRYQESSVPQHYQFCQPFYKENISSLQTWCKRKFWYI